MLKDEEASTIPYAQLDHRGRLDRVDFLAATISNLAFDDAAMAMPRSRRTTSRLRPMSSAPMSAISSAAARTRLS